MSRYRPRKVRARNFDRSPMMYGTKKVDGITYEIRFYQRYGSDEFVMFTPELGGVGPFMGYPLEAVEAQLEQGIRERRGEDTGWADGPWKYDSRNKTWKRNHGYGKRMKAKAWAYSKTGGYYDGSET